MPQEVFFGCVALVVLLLLQLAVGALYQKQAFILLQVKLFRFMLLCPMVAYCLQNITNDPLSILYLAVTAVLALLAFALNYFMFK